VKRLIAVCLLSLAACNPQPEGKPVTVIEFGEDGQTKLRDGADVAQASEPAEAPVATSSACESVEFDGSKLTHCVADPAKNRIVMVLGPADGAPYRSFASLAAGRGKDAPPVAFAMNAGMYDGEGKPIGYYVENGERLQELNRNDGPGNFHMKPNGVFFGTNGKWQIRTADDFYANVADRPAFGTQSGPMLVIDGKLHPEIAEDGNSTRVRNGVGLDRQGRAHFVISSEPLSFGRLARYFRDELKTPNALYLDGSVSSLWDPAGGRMDQGYPLGPLVVVEEKAN
jgi:uncharacterized protein YigE (DUF2233 family)